MNRRRRVRTVVLAMTLALTFGTGLVRAETTGDLYVASTAGILEVVTSSAKVLDNVPMSPTPGSIAIRPDGRELYALSGGRQVVGVDLESMAVAGHTTLPAAGAALAYPRGEQLVIAMPSLRRLAVVDAGTGTLTRSEPLPGPVDLLAADRRDGRVLAAARGGHWVAVFDPGTGSVRSTTVSGSVAAVAFDGSAALVIVATSQPNRVVGLDLRDFSTSWTMSLSGAPSAVAIAGATTLVTVGRNVWALDHATSPGVATLGVSTAEPSGRRWGSLAKPAVALAVSDDASFAYALEADRVEGFAVQRPTPSGSAVSAASRTIQLPGSRAPLAIVPVPGAQPLLGGPGVDAQAGTDATPSNAAPSPTAEASNKPPRTDTVLDNAVGWLGPRSALPQAILVGIVILALGLLAVRHYERGYGVPAKARSTGSSPRRR
jgi:hypothetical protein